MTYYKKITFDLAKTIKPMDKFFLKKRVYLCISSNHPNKGKISLIVVNKKRGVFLVEISEDGVIKIYHDLRSTYYYFNNKSK